MRNKLNQIKPSIAFAWALLTCTIAYGHGVAWYEGLQPGLIVVNRVLAKQSEEPQEAHHEVLDDDEVEYTYNNTESVIIKPKPQSVEGKIREAFPDNSNEMIKLFTCESNLDSSRTGDQSLSTTQWHNGELIGRSIGIAQIRTGAVEKNGVVWSRAWKHGLSVKEYEDKLREPDFNLSEAKPIFKGMGYYGWENCAKKVGLIPE